MTKPCSRILNRTVSKWGLEINDFVILGVVAALLLVLLPPYLWLVVAPALLYGVYKAKKGKPRGALLHALHGLCLVPGTGLLSPWPQTYSPWKERTMGFDMDRLVGAVDQDDRRVQLGVRVAGLGIGGILIALVLSTIFLVQTLRPEPKYLVPPLGAGLVIPGYIDNLTAQDVATKVFQARWTWSAVDHARVGAQLKGLLDVTLHKPLDEALRREERLIREHKLSTAATPLKATILDRKQDAVVVRIEGTRTLFVEGLALDPEPTWMSMVLRPAPAPAPHGVQVMAFDPGPALKMEGRK